jgi:hypothetical protein
MRMKGTDYPRSLPKAVPDGKRLVHNRVRPSRRQGERGAGFFGHREHSALAAETPSPA